MVPSRDLLKTANFLVRALGFELSFESASYLVLTRGGYNLHLCQAGEQIGQMSIYLEVDDLDATWQTFTTADTDAVRVREPFQQDYGMREFHTDLPHTETLLFVGERG